MLNRVSVSVVIPCYNCNNTIERALDSVANQTELPAEVLLVDDNEDKLQTEYLFKVTSKYQILNIKLICHIKNFGAPSARNTGWNLASSEYIAFLDADDSWHPQKIEFQFDFMSKNNNISLTGHNIDIVNKIDTYENIDSISAKECSKANILLRNIFPTPTLMIKRNLGIRFDESMRYVDDHLLLMNIILQNNKAYKINNKLAYVYKSMYGESGLSSNMYLMERHELIAYKKIFRKDLISRVFYYFLIAFSLVKYFRRIVISFVKKT